MPTSMAAVAVGDVLKDEPKYNSGYSDSRKNLFDLTEALVSAEGLLPEKDMDKFKQMIMKADGDACRGMLEVDLMMESVKSMQNEVLSAVLPPPPPSSDPTQPTPFIPMLSTGFTATMRTAVEDRPKIPDSRVKVDKRIISNAEKLSVTWDGKRKKSNEGDDDLMVVAGGDRAKELQCSISAKLFENPYRNKVCGHTFDKTSLDQWLRQKKTKCPFPGCSNKNKGGEMKFYEFDEDMKLKVESFKRRKQREIEKKRREEEDSDDEEEVL